MISSFLHSFLKIWIPIWHHFSSAWRIYVSIFHSVGLLATNSTFHLPENAFLLWFYSFFFSSALLKCDSFLVNIFIWYEILSWEFFLPSPKKILFHCFLTSTVTNEKSQIAVMKLLFHRMQCVFFSLPAFKIFSSSLLLNGFTMICLVDFLCIYSSLIHKNVWI